jgi:hypothetical protein
MSLLFLQVKFTTSVDWKQTTTTYDQRLQRYEKFPLNPIHLEVRPLAGGADWQLVGQM